MNRLGKLLAAGIVGVAVFFIADSPKYSGRNEPVNTTKISTASLEEITFEEARKDESKRQQYIDQIVNKYGKPHYVSQVVYDPNETGHSEQETAKIYKKLNPIGGFMATGPIKGQFRDIGRRNLKMRTKITRMAFEQESEEYFMVGILSHERNIAKCLYEGFSKVPIDIIYIQENGEKKILSDVLTLLLEIESYSADIDFCRQNNVSAGQTNFIATCFKTYYTELKKYVEAVPEHLKTQLETAVKAYERKDIK